MKILKTGLFGVSTVAHLRPRHYPTPVHCGVLSLSLWQSGPVDPFKTPKQRFPSSISSSPSQYGITVAKFGWFKRADGSIGILAGPKEVEWWWLPRNNANSRCFRRA